MALGLSQIARQLYDDETTFSMRRAAAPLIVAALIGLNGSLLAMEGGIWSTATVAAALVLTALLAPPAVGLAGVLLKRVPPTAADRLEEIIERASEQTGEMLDLDQLITSLTTLDEALSKSGVALVSFNPDLTLILKDGDVEQRSTGPGAQLRDMLATPLYVRPLLAAHLVHRAVREPALRPMAELIEEVSAELIVPLPGGPGGMLAGALLVGRPKRGRLKARRAACLLALARSLGPRFRAAVMLELAGRRIGELESTRSLDEDRLERLDYQLERLGEENRLLRADRAGTSPKEVVGRSGAMQHLLAKIDQAAGVRSSLLIRGESGTGRTLVARMIHEASDRREGPLVYFGCAGVPQGSHLPTLLGQADGTIARPGLIKLADQGTLLLEEIGALSLDAQAELIRLLASSEVSGTPNANADPTLRQVDVRVVGTTGRTSADAIAQDTLLPELHDRLKALQLRVPPLRERGGDIPELALFFLKKIASRHGIALQGFQQEALDALDAYLWPGNVRQLRAVIEHAALTAKGRVVTLADLPDLGQKPTADVTPGRTVLKGTFEEVEREVLRSALSQANGNKTEAARHLGLKRTTFTSRLRKYGLG